MIENYKVEAALRSLNSHPIFHIDMVGIPFEMMRKALEAASNAKPPTQEVVTEEMKVAGSRVVSAGWGSAGAYTMLATDVYTAMHALAPKPAMPAMPEVTDEAVNIARATYDINMDFTVGSSNRAWSAALTAALKVMFPDTRPKAREPHTLPWFPRMTKPFACIPTADPRSGKDRRCGKKDFFNPWCREKLTRRKADRRTSEGR